MEEMHVYIDSDQTYQIFFYDRESVTNVLDFGIVEEVKYNVIVMCPCENICVTMRDGS